VAKDTLRALFLTVCVLIDKSIKILTLRTYDSYMKVKGMFPWDDNTGK